MTYEPQLLHTTFLLAHEAQASEDGVLAEVKLRMADQMAHEIAKIILEYPGGVLMTPLTWTINDDDQIGAARVAGSVNVQRLPDPDTEYYYLVGGRMNGRSVRPGANPPRTLLVPWVPPVSVMYEGPSYLTLEYRLYEGSTAYQFVAEFGA